MGLFVRKSSKPISGGGGNSSSIARVNNIPNTNDNDVTQNYLASHKKREFCKSVNNLESTAVDEAGIISFSNSVAKKIQLIELQLQQRDMTISQLRQTIEASEKVQSERINLLESQVERLVDISSRNSQLLQTMEASENAQSERIDSLEQQLECFAKLPPSDRAACQGSSSLPFNPINMHKRHDVVEDDDSHHEGIQEHQNLEAKMGLSTLQELLGQVLAKKDRLNLKNNFHSGLASYSSSSFESNDMPCSIEELDNMIEELERMIWQEHITKRGADITNCQQDQHLESNNEWCQEEYYPDDYDHENEISQERKTKRGADIDNCQQDQHLESNDEWAQGDSPPDDYHHSQNESNENESSRPAPFEGQHSVFYKMTFRNCPLEQSDANYVGRISTTFNSSTQDLAATVTHHFSQAWEMIQDHQDDGSISLGIYGGGGLKRERSRSNVGFNDGSFASSSLARSFVMEYYRQFSHEEEVLQWCMENIKVEIKQDEADPMSPPEKKKRRKKKHKKSRKSTITP